MNDSLKIHLPSIGIGAGIVIGIVLTMFLIFGHSLTSAQSQDKKQDNSDQQQILSLISENASPVLGAKNAPITMIEFGDYQCYYCNNFYHTIEPDIVKNYINTGKVKMIFKDFTIIGQDSVTAANAAHCAQDQGKFWEYHNALYDNWSGENTGWISLSGLTTFAKQVGLNQETFRQCVTQSKFIPTVRASVSDAKNLGLTGTPDFFIIAPDNSIEKVVGAQPYEVFDEIFKSKLK